jgi:hypothetical protein
LRKGLVLHSLGLICLLIGLVVSYVASSLSGHLVSAVFIVLAGASGLVAAVFISNEAGSRRLIVGAALIGTGAAPIPASNIALRTYSISETGHYVYQDTGATIAACGCVVAAYSFFVLRSRDAGPAVTSAQPPLRGLA